MAIIVFYQNSKNIVEYKKTNLINLEYQILDSYNYIINHTQESPENLKKTLQNRVFELANIFNTNITLYDVYGNIIAYSSNAKTPIKKSIIEEMKRNEGRVFIDSMTSKKNVGTLISYNFLKNANVPIAILKTQSSIYYSSMHYQTEVLIKQFILILIFLMILSGIISWYISRSITGKIEEVAQKLQDTNVVQLNQPLDYAYNDEIKPMVFAYNKMLDKLKEQTLQIQKTEREEAWKEMAKQVAHEINNPLTPLRLTVQNFQRKFIPEDPENSQKINDLTKSIIQQIDLISSITKSFSDFAKMPINADREIDVVQSIKSTLNIFPQDVVSFTSDIEKYFYTIDHLYLTRIVTNIVKNGIQAIPYGKIKKITVNLQTETQYFIISIKDNGKGISSDLKDKVFLPKFTTKSSGMGLGLSMVKKIVEDYGGEIWYESLTNDGTTFFVKFFKSQNEK